MKKILLLFFILPFIVPAQYIPEKPNTYVVDEADVMSTEQEKMLGHKLRQFRDSTSTQVCVYVTASLNGEDMSSLCQKIFQKWEIGQDKKDNGVLIAVFVNDHKFRIHTGYGMEGILPDLLTKKIQDEYMRPAFKQNNYYLGIDQGVDQIIYYSKNEYKPEAEDVKPLETIDYVICYSVTLFIYALLFLLMFFGFKNKPVAQKAILIIAGIFALIPLVNMVFTLLFLIIMSIVKVVMLIAGSGRGNWSKSSGGGGSEWTYSSGVSSDSSWSSSSDSDYSGSSSDDSYSSGGGDSGGGGSNSDW